MVIGALRIELYIDGNRSLKGKRRMLRSVIQRVKSRFGNVSISEVDSQDLWQRATIGVSFVSNDAPYVNSVMDQISGFIESMGIAQVVSRDLEIIHF
ncbi:MAG: DUF503 domain-containing protein [Candidatus Dadabacteria bacterium]|nr:DUF503 domain-containing protein [Candidatus Dadabacteria bacterium]